MFRFAIERSLMLLVLGLLCVGGTKVAEAQTCQQGCWMVQYYIYLDALQGLGFCRGFDGTEKRSTWCDPNHVAFAKGTVFKNTNLGNKSKCVFVIDEEGKDEKIPYYEGKCDLKCLKSELPQVAGQKRGEFIYKGFTEYGECLLPGGS